MDYLGTDLYDIDTGKYAVNMLYADLTWKQHTDFNENKNAYNITRGLLCKKVETNDKHFKYDVHFFTKYPESNTSLGINVNITQNVEISNLTMDLQNKNQHTSLEYFGYFKTPTTGIYNIKITTGNNDSALLWIGDDALVNYSTDNIISDNKNTTLVVKVVKDKYYPIRIQYGTNNKSPNILLEIVSDNNTTQNVIDPIDNYLFSINKSNVPYEPIQLCFSFIKTNDSDNLFRLMVSKYDINNNVEYNNLIRNSISNPKILFRDIPIFPAGLISFQNTGNLLLTNVNGNTVDLTKIPNYMSCQNGTDIPNTPRIQVNDESITANLTSNTTTDIDVNTGLPYKQFTYSGSNPHPSNRSNDIYSANYVIGNTAKTNTFSSIPEINVSNLDKISQCSFTLTFTNDGDIQINNEKQIIWTFFNGITNKRNSNITSQFEQHATEIKAAMSSSNTVVVRDWYQEYYNSYMNVNGLGSVLRNTMKGGSNFTSDLISSNGKCKITKNQAGEYVFRYAIKTPDRNYATTDELNTGLVYLFSARMDMKVGKTFMANSIDNTIQYMPATTDGNNIIQYSNIYTKYDGKYPYPPNVLETGSNYLHWQNVGTSCDIMCNKTNGCTHYYSYKTTDGSTHCTINNDGTSARYFPEKPKDNISSANLYIRDKMIKSECNINKFLPYDPKINSLIDSTAYDNYTIKYSSYPTTQEGPCGDNTINSNIQSYLLNSNTQKEGFGTREKTWRESFTSACDSSNPNVDACRTELINKITSLKDNEANTFDKHQEQINTNYNKLNQNVDYYKTLHPKVNGPYDAIDDQGHLNYMYNDKPSPHLEDIRLEDSRQQLIDENNLYIFGTIITASLLILILSISNR
jgi:hypothetical protein